MVRPFGVTGRDGTPDAGVHVPGLRQGRVAPKCTGSGFSNSGLLRADMAQARPSVSPLSRTPIGISEGAVSCQVAWVSSLRFFGAEGAADPPGRRGGWGVPAKTGVKVERPEPKARTYDLDATVGRRTIGQRRWCGGSVVDRPEAGVRIVSLTGGGG